MDGLTLETGALRTRLAEGRLTGVQVAGEEAWHGVHFLLRDAHWRTPTLVLGEPVREALGTGWRVSVSGGFEGVPGVALRIEVQGHDDGHTPGGGTLLFTGTAQIDEDIEVNRLGLCLLHPLVVSGRALVVLHDDGRETSSTFPELIPAWPPFTAIQALRHELADGRWGVAEFTGDSFEMEDQRNNADASFKTYSRSNFMPRPYLLRAGQCVRQSVRLHIEGSAQPGARRATRTWAAAPACTAHVADFAHAAPAVHAADHADAAHIGVFNDAAIADARRHVSTQAFAARLGLELTLDDLRNPALAAATAAAVRPHYLHLCISAAAAPFDANVLALVLGSRPSNRQVEPAPADGWRGPIGLRLDVLDVPAHRPCAALAPIAVALREAGIQATDVAVFPSSAEVVAAARECFPSAPRIGGGTPDFFVQLNRLERLPLLDFLAFTVCPIVHAADNATVMASPASAAGMLHTLAHRYPGVPVQVGPSGIAARRSPLGALAPSNGRRPVPLAAIDPREGTAFEAEWVAAHVAAFVAAGAQAVTVSRLAACRPGSPLALAWARLLLR